MPEPSASALSANMLERIAAARGEMRPFSDVDLGLLLPDDPDLMDLGELAGRVEDICRRPVDIVRLRGLPERDPELAFRIADEGAPILESRRYAFADFKKDAFLWYMDTAPTGPCVTDWSNRSRSSSTSRARSWRGETWRRPRRTVNASRRFRPPAFSRKSSPTRSSG